MEANDEKKQPEEKKGHLVRNILLGAFGLFVLVALLNPTPAVPEQSDNTKETEQTVAAEPAKPAERTVWDNGTYEVGKDVQVGKYKSVADSCYWSISSDANGDDILSNGMQSGQQIIELTTVGQYLTVQNCQFKREV